MVAGSNPAAGISRKQADLSNGWIGQKLDVLYTLPQLVKHNVPAFEQRMGIDCRLDTRGLRSRAEPQVRAQGWQSLPTRLPATSPMRAAFAILPAHDGGQDIRSRNFT
jgi:hypothetical protein